MFTKFHTARLKWCLLLPLLAGCSQKSSSMYETLNLAFFGQVDAHVSTQYVDSLPWASIYAQIDGQPRAFMVLGFAEPGYSIQKVGTQGSRLTQLKWLSAQNEMLVTEEGRLIKTHGLQIGNLTGSYSVEPDPIALGLHLSDTPREWSRTIDWMPGNHFGYRVDSVFHHAGVQTLWINDKAVETLYVTEHVNVPLLDLSYENHFWLSPVSGQVISSKQTIAPGLPQLEVTNLKPFNGVVQ